MQLSEAEAEPLYSAALTAGLAEQEAEIRQRLTAAASAAGNKGQQEQEQQPVALPEQADPLDSLPEEVLRQLRQIKVRTILMCRVTGYRAFLRQLARDDFPAALLDGHPTVTWLPPINALPLILSNACSLFPRYSAAAA